MSKLNNRGRSLALKEKTMRWNSVGRFLLICSCVLAFCRQPQPARAGPGQAPEWAALPELSVTAWPAPIVLPAPVVVTLRYAAPPDKPAMGPIVHEEDGLLIALWVELLGEDGTVLAKGSKLPDGSNGVHFWLTRIHPGQALEKQILILWDPKTTGWQKLDKDSLTEATLLVKSTVAADVRRRLPPDEQGRFVKRVPVRVRVPASGNDLAIRLHEGRLLGDYNMWDWACLSRKGEARLETLLQESPRDSTWQIAKGVLLWTRLGRATPDGRTENMSAYNAVKADIDEFAAEFPGCPLTEHLLYRADVMAGQDGNSTRARVARAIAAKIPGGSIAANAWYFNQTPQEREWPATQPVVGPASQEAR